MLTQKIHIRHRHDHCARPRSTSKVRGVVFLEATSRSRPADCTAGDSRKEELVSDRSEGLLEREQVGSECCSPSPVHERRPGRDGVGCRRDGVSGWAGAPYRRRWRAS